MEDVIKYGLERRIKLTSLRSLIHRRIRVRESRFSLAIFLRGFDAHARSRANTAYRECGDRPAATNSVTRTCTAPRISLYPAHDEIFMLHLSCDFRHRFNDVGPTGAKQKYRIRILFGAYNEKLIIDHCNNR